jgi:hypothetical protein
VKRQTSAVRTNCIDCLDRTNVVQSVIAHQYFTTQLRENGLLDDKSIIQSLEDGKVERMFKNSKESFSLVTSYLHSPVSLGGQCGLHEYPLLWYTCPENRLYEVCLARIYSQLDHNLMK